MVTYTAWETRMDCYASWNLYLPGEWSRVSCNAHGSLACLVTSHNRLIGRRCTNTAIIRRDCSWFKSMSRLFWKIVSLLSSWSASLVRWWIVSCSCFGCIFKVKRKRYNNIQSRANWIGTTWVWFKVSSTVLKRLWSNGWVCNSSICIFVKWSLWLDETRQSYILVYV